MKKFEARTEESALNGQSNIEEKARALDKQVRVLPTTLCEGTVQMLAPDGSASGR